MAGEAQGGIPALCVQQVWAPSRGLPGRPSLLHPKRNLPTHAPPLSLPHRDMPADELVAAFSGLSSLVSLRSFSMEGTEVAMLDSREQVEEARGRKGGGREHRKGARGGWGWQKQRVRAGR